VTTRPDLVTDDPQLARAIREVAAARSGAVSFVSRRLNITHGAALGLLDEMTRRGITGPAGGWKDRVVHVRRCHHCGRIGTRGYTPLPGAAHAAHDTRTCTNVRACRRRQKAGAAGGHLTEGGVR
jgi:hypothetical protein